MQRKRATLSQHSKTNYKPKRGNQFGLSLIGHQIRDYLLSRKLDFLSHFAECDTVFKSNLWDKSYTYMVATVTPPWTQVTEQQVYELSEQESEVMHCGWHSCFQNYSPARSVLLVTSAFQRGDKGETPLVQPSSLSPTLFFSTTWRDVLWCTEFLL